MSEIESEMVTGVPSLVQRLEGVDWDSLYGVVEAPPEYRLSGAKAWLWPEGLPLPKWSENTAAVEFRVIGTMKGAGVQRRPDGSKGISLVFDVIDVAEVNL